VLTELAATGDNFAKSFNVFLTYPFVDEVVGRDPQVARNLHMGDYTNLSIQMDVSVTGDDPAAPPTVPTDLPTILDPTVILDNVAKCLRSGDPSSAACRKVLRNVESLAELREECRKKQNAKKDICKEVNLVPGAPLPSGGGGGGLTSELPDLAGVPRAAYGTMEPWSRKGPTMRQLMKVYDPALVGLLVPGMVIR
jgi:phospholipid/cholesterol/gamma-HCH transport system substrate-binding protein